LHTPRFPGLSSRPPGFAPVARMNRAIRPSVFRRREMEPCLPNNSAAPGESWPLNRGAVGLDSGHCPASFLDVKMNGVGMFGCVAIVVNNLRASWAAAYLVVNERPRRIGIEVAIGGRGGRR
jgi:hypothetical protein